MAVVIDIVKAVGFSGIIFVIWLLTLKFFMQVLDQQKNSFKETLDEMSARNRENFEVLNKFAQGTEYLGGKMAEVESKIENNRFCPIVRDETRPPTVRP